MNDGIFGKNAAIYLVHYISHLRKIHFQFLTGELNILQTSVGRRRGGGGLLRLAPRGIVAREEKGSVMLKDTSVVGNIRYQARMHAVTHPV